MNSSEFTVLVVCPDRLTRPKLYALLSDEGYRVVLANDGAEAVEIAQTDWPHAVVADWEMLPPDGPNSCQVVRKAQAAHYVTIILLAPELDTEDRIRGLEAGADTILTEPVAPEEVVVQLRSTYKRFEFETALQRAAMFDPLTGIPNRRFFYWQFDRELARASRSRHALSCALLDIDFFKKINDTYGHAAGDDCIKEVAKLLTDRSRRSDCVCRYGGEEFCVLLPEKSESEAAVWADRARRAIAEMVIPAAAPTLKLTASIGVAARLDDTENPESLVDNADQALLVAKQSGRNRVVRFRSLDELALETMNEASQPTEFLGDVLARDIMTTPVVSLQEDETNAQAAEFLLRYGITSVPVVDAAQRLTGILSEKDLIQQLRCSDLWNKPVRELMNDSVIQYDEEVPAREIWNFLCRVAVRRVVVVKNRKPTGVISRASFLRWFHNRSQSLMAVEGGCSTR